ncbi:MAG: hypothetical protein CVV48_08320 [Spirochaetae bacterium HGW-Spirochaetae-4]|nr:MAG: hypothetical protein CVV48_08320 [Spirochaetae bacterium HGW-Spirochaetae-4]
MIKPNEIEMIKNVPISSVQRFLGSANWENTFSQANVLEIWKTQFEDKSFEIILPLRDSFKDFLQKYIQVFNELSIRYSKNLEGIINLINSQATDIIQVRAKGPDLIDGSIPMGEGVDLFINAKEMMLAAALAAYKKKKMFLGSLPDMTTDYLNSLYFGQTEIGSYVVNIKVPINASTSLDPENVENDGLGINSTYSRKVTKTLSEGLRSLKMTTREYISSRDEAIFVEAVEHGVSSNLCDAIVGISNRISKREIAISVRYPVSIDENIEEVIEFRKDDIEVIERISSVFKEETTQQNFTVSGYVLKLHRDEKEEAGKITLKAPLDGIEKSVKISLNKDDYEKAIIAHEKKCKLQCTGFLVVKPRKIQLVDVINVQELTEEAPDLFNSPPSEQ